MSGDLFRTWLAERVGDDPGKVSRRELARRLSSDGDPEVYRRTIRRILDGTIGNPTQATRDSIQAALQDHTAPSTDDEEEELLAALDVRSLLAAQRTLSKQLTRALRSVAS